VQLDCTPNKSHREQLKFITRIVEISDKAEVQINEYFIAFIHIISSTGSSLTEELKAHLAALEISLSDCRGQAYDNGANMVGRHQGVRSRILSENPRALFVPCSAHSLNLLLGDSFNSAHGDVVLWHNSMFLHNFCSIYRKMKNSYHPCY
jgi:hypothetical protein